MTKQEALLYLSTTEENWEEDLELLIFNLKKDLFRRVLIPKLLVKKAEKVAVWQAAAHALRGESSTEVLKSTIELPSGDLFKKEPLIELYRSFETQLIQLQLKLSQSLVPKQVAETIYKIAALEAGRQKALLPLAQKLLTGTESTFEVKISEDAQTGVILSELKQLIKEEFKEKKDLLLLPNFEKDLQRILKSN
jgi:hypothetical protein